MTQKEKRMLGWLKASCIWSIVTGAIALCAAVVVASYSSLFENPLWLYLSILCLAAFGGMQIIDGLVRLDYSNKIKWTLEDRVEIEAPTEIMDDSATLHGRIR